MNGQKHALVLFSKAPLPGLTKTRLLKEKGGILTPKEAADFYQATMLDVAEVGFRALAQCSEPVKTEEGNEPDSYDFVVSCSPESESPLMQSIFAEGGPWPAPIHFIVDRGTNFDEHFNDAYRQLFDRGYQSVVAIGGDMPTMRPDQIQRAFQWLAYLGALSDRGGLVIAPCQECGVSLVGLTRDAPMDFTGVFYNLDGVPALDGIMATAEARDIPTAMLEPVGDIDSPEDLAHAFSMIRAMAYTCQFQPETLVPKRTLAWIEQAGLVVVTPPDKNHDPREHIDG